MFSFSSQFFPKDWFHCQDLKDVIGITSPVSFKSLMMELVFLMVVSGVFHNTPQFKRLMCRLCPSLSIHIQTIYSDLGIQSPNRFMVTQDL